MLTAALMITGCGAAQSPAPQSPAAPTPAAPTPAAQPPDDPPTTDQLKRMLLTPADLEALTHTTWSTQPVIGGGLAGPSGCPELDNVVLADNTGLTTSGLQDYVSAEGHLIEENVVHDPNAIADIKALATAIAHCPALSFEGIYAPIEALDLGSNVAAFRVFINGVSRSVVLNGSHGDYVVELIAGDHNNSDSFWRSLLDAAYHRIDHPS
jgi:hypothetical protein